MTQEDYLKQNQKGFEGDSFIQRDLTKLIADNKIDAIVETGTYLGNTTNKFCDMVANVYTIEINIEFQATAKQLLKDRTNVKMYLGKSEEVLRKVLALKELKDKNILCFLDAHWGNFCPLLDELKIIAAAGIKPVIAIHDFKNPNKPDYGYDSYNNQEFTFEWIKPYVDKIYGEGNYIIQYNDEAEGAKRGVIYITYLPSPDPIKD